MRGSGMAFFLQGLNRSARTSHRWLSSRTALTLAIIVSRFFPGVGGCFALLRRLGFDTRASGFREPDRYGLLRGCGPMFPFADVMHLFAHKFSSLSTGRLAFACVFTRPIDGFFLRHRDLLLGQVSICRGRTASKNCCREECWLL